MNYEGFFQFMKARLHFLFALPVANDRNIKKKTKAEGDCLYRNSNQHVKNGFKIPNANDCCFILNTYKYIQIATAPQYNLGNAKI